MSKINLSEKWVSVNGNGVQHTEDDGIAEIWSVEPRTMSLPRAMAFVFGEASGMGKIVDVLTEHGTTKILTRKRVGTVTMCLEFSGATPVMQRILQALVLDINVLAGSGAPMSNTIVDLSGLTPRNRWPHMQVRQRISAAILEACDVHIDEDIECRVLPLKLDDLVFALEFWHCFGGHLKGIADELHTAA